MSETDPAFPSHGSMGEVNHQGMSLRDYFAAHAMQAVIIAHPYWGERAGSDKRIASVAYHLADAMLAERDSPRQSQTEAAHLGYGG